MKFKGLLLSVIILFICYPLAGHAEECVGTTAEASMPDTGRGDEVGQGSTSATSSETPSRGFEESSGGNSSYDYGSGGGNSSAAP